jgi:glucose/arabinose dehydrogenase
MNLYNLGHMAVKRSATLSCLGFLALSLTNINCYRLRGSQGGGQIEAIAPRTVDQKDIAMQPGYQIQPVISGLNFPTAVAFDDQNQLYVIESGYSYGEVFVEPKLLRVDGDKATLIAKGAKNGPWTGVTWYDGAFYVAEGGAMNGGKILKITKDGTITALISDLPTVGDHHTNGPAIKDGYIYFSQGVATNSAVVGTDNADFGWLIRKKDFHDIPCTDITLTGQNYTSPNVLTDDPNDETSTGAFVPFGTATTPGQVIKGAVPCTGSVLRIPVSGGQAELVSWGFRNPFGLAFHPDGRLFITENGYDTRGSRPVWGAGDALWEIKTGVWYGFPDYSAGKSIVDDEEFKTPGKERVKALLKNYPNVPPKPNAIFAVHSSSDGFDFSRNADFGYPGEAFVAQFGDMPPGAGKVLFPVGFKIVRANIETGVINDFAVNKGKRNGPASWLKQGGLERPVSVKFDQPGTALYVVDFGILKTDKEGSHPQANTGMIWKITKQ